MLDWLYVTAIGSPKHVDIVVGCVVYVVGPGRYGCATMPADAYLTCLRIRSELVGFVTVPINDIETVRVAADIYCVGPMTVRRTIIRALTGRGDPLDLDCVQSAIAVLKQAGLNPPNIRTPKGLFRWISTHPLASID